MGKPLHQKVAIGGVFLLGGLLALGSFLDSLENALALITPAVTYGGTATGILVILGLRYGLPRRPLRWIISGGAEIRVARIGWRPVLSLAGAILLLWVPRAADLFNREYASIRESESSLPVYTPQVNEPGVASFQTTWPIPMIAAARIDENGWNWSGDASDVSYEHKLRVSPGDHLLVSVFFVNPAHHSAYSTADNTRVAVAFDTNPSLEHSVSAGITMDNGYAVYSWASERGGNLRLRADALVRLEYVTGSTYLCARHPPLASRAPPTPDDPTGMCGESVRKVQAGSSVYRTGLPTRRSAWVTSLANIPES